ncbi:hypothetical protein SE17_02930 [Kouleothrix aurantiaca]|uniref:Uncharacterized protein n=1 Tax=Kouleothrix aurantiaca TaxID=186479 RepID=A0A0P9FD00_9CHLR|nr:hypothetical protein SE17_02930 [Kouleothrix aurantiaca]
MRICACRAAWCATGIVWPQRLLVADVGVVGAARGFLEVKCADLHARLKQEYWSYSRDERLANNCVVAQSLVGQSRLKIDVAGKELEPSINDNEIARKELKLSRKEFE